MLIFSSVLRRLMRLIVHMYGVDLAEINKTSLHMTAVPAVVTPARVRLLRFDDSLIDAICEMSILDTPTTELYLDFLWLVLTHGTSIGDLQRLVHSHGEALYRLSVYHPV